jgi:hypothetical protein
LHSSYLNFWRDFSRGEVSKPNYTRQPHALGRPQAEGGMANTMVIALDGLRNFHKTMLNNSGTMIKKLGAELGRQSVQSGSNLLEATAIKSQLYQIPILYLCDLEAHLRFEASGHPLGSLHR